MTTSVTIQVVIGDQDEYVKSVDGTEDYDARVAAVSKRLEAEFGASFQPVSIGRGAEGTGFLAVIQLIASGGFALLIAGKQIEESLDAYSRLFRKYINPFLPRKPFLDRNGALLSVMNELSDRIGKEVRSAQLLGYKCLSVLAEESEPKELNGIEPAGDDLAGDEIHLFELEIDGKRVRAAVFNRKVTLRMEGETHPILPNISRTCR
jgi:hypothetical protein